MPSQQCDRGHIGRKQMGVLLAMAMTLGTGSAMADEFNLGVYYYPGWKDNQIAMRSALPWEPIANYPEREPLLGWYQEGDPALMAQQLEWMHYANIDYVIFDWLWGRTNEAYLEHAVNSYLQLPSGKAVKFSILWANHTTYIFSLAQLDAMVHYWCTHFFNSPDYQQLDGKPLVYIFLAKVLNNNIASLGMTNAEFFAHVDAIAQQYGLAGISFVGGSWGNDKELSYAASTGYAAFSSYNLHSPATFRLADSGVNNMFRTYGDLDVSYRDHWQWMLNHSEPSYIVPTSSGWDKRPWGGSSDPLHDNSTSTPEQFETHLLAAKALMLSADAKTRKMAVICCWNEYGEGSYIEPTKADGFNMLNVIRKVFPAE